jgi:hypothetical protein
MLVVEGFQKFAGIPFGISRIFESLMPQQIGANRRKNRSIQVKVKQELKSMTNRSKYNSGNVTKGYPPRSGAAVLAWMGLGLVAFILGQGMVWALQQSSKNPVPWLDIPAGWSRGIQDQVVTLVPGDLPHGAALLFMIEPPVPHNQSLAGAYQKALSDLGPWKPVGQVQEQAANNGWRFRFGVGVTQLQGVTYTALTAVAIRKDLLARFWVLADSDATYNRYQAAVLTAISSVQDIKGTPATGVTPASGAIIAGKLDAAFGKGISGVYVGWERGIHATTATPGQSWIMDYQEVEVLFPDGTYRRGLPLRGLNSDLNWERRHQLTLWGSWRQQGNNIILRRGDYQSQYARKGEQLIDSSGRSWNKQKLPGVQRIDGVYARADFRDADAPRLVLRADGSYEDRGRFLRMVSSAWNLVEPDGESMVTRLSESEYQKLLGPSRGTYSFENFTLTLRAQDGRLWQVNALVLSNESYPNVKQLMVNTYKLQRD